MSPKQIFTLVLAVTALTAQVAFAAGMPSNVQNIQASLSSEALTVSWAPVAEAQFYRIYYSHESILSNQGNYDDFETTPTNAATYTFTKLPLNSQEIFVSVLAVDVDGNESEGFEGEASVRTQSSSSSIVSSIPTVVTSSAPSSESLVMPQGEFPTTTAEPMTIRTVSTLSSTGVLIVFSKNIQQDAVINPAFFSITSSGGVALTVTSVFINGPTALLATDTQIPERDYRFRFLLPIPAGDGTNAIPSGQEIPFRGFGLALTEDPTLTIPEVKPEVPYGQNPMLGALPPQTIPTPLPVTTTKPPTSDLPDSGVGLLSVFALAGAGAGARFRRRKTKLL